MGDYANQAAKLEHDENQYRATTIEEAVAQMVKASEDNQTTVINTLVKILQNNNFRLTYNECIEMIPNKKSVHVECRVRELGIIEFLLQVAEKGWDNVYIVHKKVYIFLVTREIDNKGKILLPREKFIKKDPKTGKEKIKYSKAVRENKVAAKEYTGEPILFKKSKARRNEFVKLLAENNISDPWAIDADHLDTVNNLNEFCGMENLHWSEIEIHLTTIGLIVVTARGKTVRITEGKFGLINKNTGAPNQTYGVLVSFAEGEPVIKASRRMTVKRVRDLLRDNFGINKTPIELGGGLYKPKFKISFSEYKRNRGEGGTVPLSSGKFLGAIADPNSPNPEDIYKNYRIGSDRDNTEDDNADKWLSEHDPHHPEN